MRLEQGFHYYSSELLCNHAKKSTLMIWFVESKLYFWDVDKKIRIRIDTTLGSPKFTNDRLFAHTAPKSHSGTSGVIHTKIGAFDPIIIMSNKRRVIFPGSIGFPRHV